MIAYAMKVQIVKKGSTLLCRQVTTFMLQKSPQIREKKKKTLWFQVSCLAIFSNTEEVGMGEGTCVYYSPNGHK